MATSSQRNVGFRVALGLIGVWGLGLIGLSFFFRGLGFSNLGFRAYKGLGI